MNDLLLEARDVTKNFGGLQAISQVSFNIRKGEIFSVIGPNGAGKTTLFNLITAFLPPTGGGDLF
jgi:branched-chain amino acid transport system ATP-binding protein